MSQFWSSIVHTLTPYVPGEQPKVDNLIKLNTNENPYPPSPKALQAIDEANNEKLKLYPDPNAEQLKLAVAKYYDLSKDQVFLGNGSDEVLAHAFQGLLKHDKPLLFPDISYSFYPVYCGLYDIDYRLVPLTESFEINIEDYNQPCSGIIFPNPNAPTGRLLALEAVEKLLNNHPDAVVVVDEAYIDFGGQTAAVLVNQYPNVLVTQSLSKSRSLAGLRVGLALGQAHLIEALERVKNSFNSYPLDRLAIPASIAAFEDQDYFEQTCQKIIDSRNQVTQTMEALGFHVLPSAANFVFATHPTLKAETIAKQLRDEAIIVRYFNKPRIDNFLRITIGNDFENTRLCEVLTDIVNRAK